MSGKTTKNDRNTVDVSNCKLAKQPNGSGRAHPAGNLFTGVAVTVRFRSKTEANFAKKLTALKAKAAH